MEFYSTLNKTERVSFRTAIMKGIADDRGLFMPAYIPAVDPNVIRNLSDLNLKDIAFIISKSFVQDEIDNSNLEQIVDSSITFGTPVVHITDNISILELFHGPTLAFKDFGARFMARTMQYFLKDCDDKITILVATSGDTGSAVANGFLNVDGINIVVLFPKNKISKIQEKQITTLGNNIFPLEIEGNFDDCQRLVKTAFVDPDIKANIRLSSANSINIGRLIPQTFYYFEGYKQVKDKDVVFTVPSGNLGNLTAGIISMKMGLPVSKFIAATNINDVFTQYISSGKFKTKNSKLTYSNAMDVGDPSNFERILNLFDNNYSSVLNHVYSKSFNDNDTVKKISDLYRNHGYMIDPHGAVGFLAAEQYILENNHEFRTLILETAHPSKFINVFHENFDFKPKIPERLSRCLDIEGNSETLSNNYEDFKEYLMN